MQTEETETFAAVGLQRKTDTTIQPRRDINCVHKHIGGDGGGAVVTNENVFNYFQSFLIDMFFSLSFCITCTQPCNMSHTI